MPSRHLLFAYCLVLKKGFWNLNVNRCDRVYEGMPYRNMTNYNLLFAYIFNLLKITVENNVHAVHCDFRKSSLINRASN